MFSKTVTKDIKRYEEAEFFRHFHKGPLEKCPQCGRMVFSPCLACRTELMGQVNDPIETTEEESLHIQLEGEQRQRYEYCRLKKIAEAIRHEEYETRKNDPYQSSVSGDATDNEFYP